MFNLGHPSLSTLYLNSGRNSFEVKMKSPFKDFSGRRQSFPSFPLFSFILFLSRRAIPFSPSCPLLRVSSRAECESGIKDSNLFNGGNIHRWAKTSYCRAEISLEHCDLLNSDVHLESEVCIPFYQQQQPNVVVCCCWPQYRSRNLVVTVRI